MRRRPAVASCGLALACLALPARGAASEPAPAGSDVGVPQWSAITMFHGLPSRNVRAIAQDPEGVLWFGTDAGLVRYDGQRLERLALGAPATPVRALAVDASGRLWIGTSAGAWLRGATDLARVPGTEGQPISAIAAGAGSALLATEQGSVLTCTVRAEGRVDVGVLGPAQAALLRRDDGALPLAAIARNDSDLLIGTLGRGLLTARGGAVEQLRDPARPFYVTSVVRDAAGRVYLGAQTGESGRGVFTLDSRHTTALDVRTGPVTALAIDATGDLWVATGERGLFRVRAGRVLAHLTSATTGGGLNSNHLLAVFVDRDGVVWTGTDRGVCRYDPRAPRQVRLAASPDANFVHTLLATRGGQLLAGTQRGLFARETPEGSWTPVEEIGRRSVHALHEAADGRWLVGSESGLHVRETDPVTGQHTWRVLAPAEPALPSARSVRAIQELAGALYLATYGQGLERVDGEQRLNVWPEPDSDPALREVISLARVGESLWIGTAHAGVFVFRNGQASRDADLSALGALWSAAPDGQGGFWIAARRGLFRYADGRVAPVVEGHDVRGLLPEAGPGRRVWCATTQSGLLKVALDASGGVLTAQLGTDYGLPSESVFALAAEPGTAEPRLVLGTNRGLAFYEPGHGTPGLRFVRVLGQRPYTPEEWSALRLDYPQNSLLVQAAAVGGRTFPEHYQYLFSLSSGSGRALRSTRTRDGQFVAESLAPGRYRIDVRALGVELLASAPLSLSFEVASAPIPWTSLALAVLLAAALLALAWGYRQNRRLLFANRALSDTRLQLVQETENERRRIARDLHDQTLADLRRLLFRSSAPNGGAGDAGQTTFREAVETISTDVRRICEDLSPSVLENVGLTAALEWALDETLKHLPPDRPCRGEFACNDDVQERLSLESTIEIQIYRIVQEALSNAVRHARPSSLRLSVALAADGALEITVEDDGLGFDVRAARPGRGLANIRSRASLIGADVEWRPHPGGGTTFWLRRSQDSPLAASSAPTEGAARC